MQNTEYLENSSKKVYVAFLDVLGFSAFIKNNPHEYAIKIYNNAFVSTQMALAIPIQTARNAPAAKLDEKRGNQKLIANLENIKIRSAVMSDSIVFWTDNDKEQDFYDLAITVQQFIRIQLMGGLPVRGAITHGELSTSCITPQGGSGMMHYQIVGKALVEAAELEKIQMWSGCAIHSNVISHCENINISKFEQHGLLVKYPIPLIDEKFEEGYVIKWICSNDEIDVEMIDSLFAMHNKAINQKNTNTKIYNTKQYVLKMIEKTSETSPMPIKLRLSLKKGEYPLLSW